MTAMEEKATPTFPPVVTKILWVLAAAALAPLLAAGAARALERETSYAVKAQLLGGLVSFELRGTLVERIDPDAGRFEIRAHGQGAGIENLFESAGALREGRWVPETTHLLVSVWGRTYRSDLRHDPQQHVARYRSRGESFFLRRLRLVEDTLELDAGQQLDDLGSATLNYAEGRWGADPDGRLRTYVVRRSGSPARQPDGRTSYRAELRALVLEPDGADEQGRPTARVDITGFSAWALPDRPARIVFGPDRRPERMRLRLRFGTSVDIEFAPARPAARPVP